MSLMSHRWGDIELEIGHEDESVQRMMKGGNT